jgi:hypothetical protein
VRLPIQALPIDRSKTLQPYLINYGAVSATPEADPQPDKDGFFSPQADPQVGICGLLSSYALIRCFQAAVAL